MKKRIFIIILLCCQVSLYKAQSWSGCGLGIPPGYNPKALFADTISNRLYASGFGAIVDGTLTANGVASWDGTKWDTFGHGALGAIGEFLFRYKNKLYLQKFDRIYAWDFATLTWDSVPGGFIANNGTINTAVVYNNDLILAGSFPKIGGVVSHNVIRFDGTTFTSVGNLNISVYIRAIEVFQNELYIGGYFGSDTLYGGIAKWNGSQWVDLNNGFRQAGPEITALKVYNNRLYAGGTFYGTKDKYMPSIAAWDGIKWNNAGAGIYYNSNPWGVVYKLHVWNNKLLVCGNLDRAGDMDVFSLAIWNDTSWCKPNSTPNLVWVSAIFQNTLYIGEQLTLDNDTVNCLGYWIGGDFIDSCGSPVGIHERNKNNLPITIYPNPTNSTLYFKDEQNDLQNATLEVINALGQTLLSIPYEKQINVSMLQSGFYNIKIKTDQGLIYNSKFIKE